MKLTLKTLASLLESGHIVTKDDASDYLQYVYDNNVSVLFHKSVNYAAVGIYGSEDGYTFFKDERGRWYCHEEPPLNDRYYLVEAGQGFRLTFYP